jgi:hypothetical protein
MRMHFRHQTMIHLVQMAADMQYMVVCNSYHNLPGPSRQVMCTPSNR